MMNAVAYRDQLAQLMPTGAAWPRDAGSVQAQLLGALAEEFARIDVRLFSLIDEADPRTTLELLPDWERVAGLPDDCTGAPDSVFERQVAVTNKIAQLGGQSIAFFTALAARLGYYVEIDEFQPFRAGSRIGRPLHGEDWGHAWRVNVFIDSDLYQSSVARMTAGSRIGRRLVGYGALNLECLISRAAPAHSVVLFTYIVEPPADFWFDFTSEEY